MTEEVLSKFIFPEAVCTSCRTLTLTSHSRLLSLAYLRDREKYD